VPESVFLVARVIPFFDAKRGGPAEIIDGAPGQFDPAPFAFDLEADLAGFARIQRIQLSAEFKNSVGDGIETERDDLVARDLEVDDRVGGTIPPIVHAQTVFALEERGLHGRLAGACSLRDGAGRGRIPCQN
jgi:hypothetical protein